MSLEASLFWRHIGFDPVLYLNFFRAQLIIISDFFVYLLVLQIRRTTLWRKISILDNLNHVIPALNPNHINFQFYLPFPVCLSNRVLDFSHGQPNAFSTKLITRATPVADFRDDFRDEFHTFFPKQLVFSNLSFPSFCCNDQLWSQTHFWIL